MNSVKNTKIAVIGMGYVGLPLAVAFGGKIETVGFDIKSKRIKELKIGIDSTKEISQKKITSAKKLKFSDNLSEIAQCNFFIIAVPTPVNKNKVPDFSPLISASEIVGKVLKKNDFVVYESTVYPGATEEVCVPILSRLSELRYNKDFFVGYSPERISPADKNDISEIIKVTSGSTPQAGKYIDQVYQQVIKAGTYLVSDMKVAEACKVIENTQRDINIAYMNEVAMLMSKIGVDSQEVIGAMKTKWNALSFVPGLVGGHCIGVDPYYLIHKAYELGHNMEMAKSARSVNDGITAKIAELTIAKMCEKGINPVNSKVLIMGASFKQNCADIRNARPFDIVKELSRFNTKVSIFDPLVDKEDVKLEYKVEMENNPKQNYYDTIILAVAHDIFKNMGIKKIKKFGKQDKCIFFDIKSIFPKKDSDIRL